MATVMTSCTECGGTGMVTRMEPQPLKGCKLRSSHRLAAQNRKCEHCSWGRVRVEVEAASLTQVNDSESAADLTCVKSGPVTFGGHEVDASGFTQDQFDRAVVRAFVDNLELGAILGAIGRFRVNGYTTDRHTCTCKAGQTDTPCKHRAYVVYQMDIAGTAWAEAA